MLSFEVIFGNFCTYSWMHSWFLQETMNESDDDTPALDTQVFSPNLTKEVYAQWYCFHSWSLQISFGWFFFTYKGFSDFWQKETSESPAERPSNPNQDGKPDDEVIFILEIIVECIHDGLSWYFFCRLWERN